MFLTALFLSFSLAAQSAPAVIPLDHFGGHLFIHVTDEHLGPLTLMLDTGFQRTTLGSKAVTKDRVHRHFWERSLDYNGFGTEKARRRYLTTEISLRSDTASGSSSDSARASLFTGPALVTDLSDVNKTFGRAFDGFLGWDFLRKWCATLDYTPARLTLRNPSQCSAPSGTYAVLHAQWTPQGLLLPAQLTFANGHAADALLHFDTGSDIGLFLNTRFRTTAGLDQRNASAEESHGFGVNGQYTTDLVTMPRIELGRQLELTPSRDMRFAIARPGAFAKVHWWDGPSAMKINRDGVIGDALLRHFRWTFDPVAKLVYAVPSESR